MNRLHLAELADDFPVEQSPRVEQSLIQKFERTDVHHTVFIPLHYEKNYAYPMLVWLHGPQDSERQLQRVMPLISMRNYVAVAPRGNCATGGDSIQFAWRQSQGAVATAERDIFECIEHTRSKFNIAAGRVFLAGYRCGGTMAFRIALRNPELFAGALSVGGPFPSGDTPLANLDKVRSLPLFIAHGREAQEYPLQQACDELRLFHAAGLSVTLRQYPGGDDLTTQMLSDMDSWLMEQVTGQSASPENDGHCLPGEMN